MKYTIREHLPEERAEIRAERAYTRELNRRLRQERAERSYARKKLQAERQKFLNSLIPEFLWNAPREDWVELIAGGIIDGTLKQHRCIHGCIICKFVGWTGTTSSRNTAYTTRQMGVFLGFSHAWVQELCNRNELTYFRLGKKRYIILDERTNKWRK
jgi:hypothetical protein